MRIQPICFALALTVPSLASAQMDAVLSAGATEITRCSAADSESCRMELGDSLGPGWALVSVEHDGVVETLALALRGTESALVVSVRDGAATIERVSAFPPTLTLTMLSGGPPTAASPLAQRESQVPFFYLYNVTDVSVRARGRITNLFFYDLAQVDASGERAIALRYHWCGNSMLGPAPVLRTGTGDVVYSTSASGAHEPLVPAAAYRGRICVEVVERGAWWGPGLDPLALLPPPPHGVPLADPTDVLCNVDEWTGQEILDRTSLPPLPAPPGRVR